MSHGAEPPSNPANAPLMLSNANMCFTADTFHDWGGTCQSNQRPPEDKESKTGRTKVGGQRDKGDEAERTEMRTGGDW